MDEKSKGLKGPRPSERPHPSERRNRQGIRIEPGGSGELQNRLATFSALVKHEPGVLAKVSGLFSRRQFNIESLTVGPTENENNARITLVVDENDTGIVQVKKQLAKQDLSDSLRKSFEERKKKLDQEKNLLLLLILIFYLS